MSLSAMENWTLGVSISKRDLPPAHFSLKIQSYSLLAKTQLEKYDSGVFEAPGGHKWRLSLHPNETNEGRRGYISLYLEIAETDTYPQGWEVYADFKLFVFDHLQKKYLTIQDAEGAMRRFNQEKTEWGFEKFLPLEAFKNSSNGYLVNDCCEFGAEVFVYSHHSGSESLAMVKKPSNGSFSYKLKSFSALNQASYLSEVFTVGERNWMLQVFPNGNTAQKGKSLTVFLYFADWKSLPTKRAIYADFKLRILDEVNGKHMEKRATHWFSSLSYTWGYPVFMSLENLHDAEKGFIKNDTLTVEVEILAVSVIKVLS